MRDELRNRELKAAGWQVIRVWEHEIRANLPQVVRSIKRVFRSRYKSRQVQH
jgi:very-short-patch-repair endonuclease